jgi:hypothetical protein
MFGASASFMTLPIYQEMSLSMPLRRDSSPMTLGISGSGAASRT